MATVPTWETPPLVLTCSLLLLLMTLMQQRSCSAPPHELGELRTAARWRFGAYHAPMVSTLHESE